MTLEPSRTDSGWFQVSRKIPRSLAAFSGRIETAGICLLTRSANHRNHKKSRAIMISSWIPYTEREIFKRITPFKRAGVFASGWLNRNLYSGDSMMNRGSILVR